MAGGVENKSFGISGLVEDSAMFCEVVEKVAGSSRSDGGKMF